MIPFPTLASLDEAPKNTVRHFSHPLGSCYRQVIDAPIQPKPVQGHRTVGLAQVFLGKYHVHLIMMPFSDDAQHRIEVSVF
jgi:hypothetical protein